MKLAITGFAGAIKAEHQKLLPDSAGVDSQNQKPGRGDLRPWKQPLPVATIPAGRQTIYRFGRDVKSDANYWFSWTTVVHAVRGYNTEDNTERTYFTGSGAPKWTDNTIALAATPYPTAYRDLGVPVPTQALTLVASGGTSANTESRYYTFTFVTNIGEESAPAPVSLELVCKTDDTVTISNIQGSPAGAFIIDRVRIYRTQSGQSGATEFFFLREVAAGTASTTDDRRDLGDVMVTTDWLPPPTDLTNLTAMWNGMLAGITKGRVRVCEAYKPYAWKVANDFPPPDAYAVALGRIGTQSLLVLTTAKPALLAGPSPDALDLTPIELGESCVAPRGVVSFGHGVAWPCPDGLAYYGQSGPKMLTAGLLTRDDWQAMNPEGIVGGVYEGAYLGFYTDSLGVRRGFLLDPLNPQGLFFLSQGYDALFFDELQDALYVYSGTSVQKWDAGAAFMTATYRSKRWQTPGVNFKVAQVVADAYPLTITVDAGPFKPAELTALVATNPAELSINGTDLRATITVGDSNPFTLPAGFDATEWQVAISTTGAVQPPVQLAQSEQELL